MSEDNKPQKLKVLKKGKRKTPSETEAEFESAIIALIYAFVRRKPEKARKIFSEMLDCGI